MHGVLTNKLNFLLDYLEKYDNIDSREVHVNMNNYMSNKLNVSFNMVNVLYTMGGAYLI